MTLDMVKTALAVLGVALVFYGAMALGLVAYRGMTLRAALTTFNEATVGFPLLGGLAVVMLWRNR